MPLCWPATMLHTVGAPGAPHEGPQSPLPHTCLPPPPPRYSGWSSASSGAGTPWEESPHFDERLLCSLTFSESPISAFDLKTVWGKECVLGGWEGGWGGGLGTTLHMGSVTLNIRQNTWNREREKDMKNRRKLATTGSLHGSPITRGLANGDMNTLLEMDLTLSMLRIIFYIY